MINLKGKKRFKALFSAIGTLFKLVRDFSAQHSPIRFSMPSSRRINRQLKFQCNLLHKTKMPSVKVFYLQAWCWRIDITERKVGVFVKLLTSSRPSFHQFRPTAGGPWPWLLRSSFALRHLSDSCRHQGNPGLRLLQCSSPFGVESWMIADPDQAWCLLLERETNQTIRSSSSVCFGRQPQLQLGSVSFPEPS